MYTLNSRKLEDIYSPLVRGARTPAAARNRRAFIANERNEITVNNRPLIIRTEEIISRALLTPESSGGGPASSPSLPGRAPPRTLARARARGFPALLVGIVSRIGVKIYMFSRSSQRDEDFSGSFLGGPPSD